MRKSVLIPVIGLFFTYSIQAQNNLDYYIHQAKQNSPLIFENTNLNKINDLEIQRIKAQYAKPQIGLTANYLFAPIISDNNNQLKFEANSAGAGNYYGYDLGDTNGGQYQAFINITQPLFNAGKIAAADEQIDIYKQINQNNTKLTEHEIEKVVADQYILCLQDNSQIRSIQEMLELLTEQKAVLQKLVENNIYKLSDCTLLNIEYQNYLSQLKSFEANYISHLLDLNIICGINDTALVQLEKADISLKPGNPNSMFDEKFRLDSLTLVAQQKVFELNYKPQLNLYANTGLNALIISDIPQRFGFSAGFTFTYPLFDGNQKKINKNKTTILKETLAFQKNNFDKQNLLQKTKITDELQSLDQRIRIAENQLNEYNYLLEIYKKEILTGELSIINYLSVLKNIHQLKSEYNLLLFEKQAVINTYNYWNW